MKSVYSENNHLIEWTQNDTILILDAISADNELSNGQLSTVDSSIDGSVGNRLHRSIDDRHNIYFNPYLQQLVEYDGASSMQESSGNWSMLENDQSDRDLNDLNNRFFSDFPPNRTIYFNYEKSEHEFCLQGRLKVTNFKADSGPILITLNFTIDLKTVAKIMTEKKDIFVVRSSLELMKTNDEDT